MENKRGVLFVISGPSGVGKGTLRKELFKRMEGLTYSVSCTTRQPREGERDGVDYRFIDMETFMNYVKENKFLEWAKVHGNYYGTLESDVRKLLDEGHDIVLEIDVQGALQVKNKMPEAVLIFIMPPSEEELIKRLDRRGTENDRELEERIKNAKKEILESKKYDFIVVNDDLKKAVEELEKIFENVKNKMRKN
ncbi:guanylate kinase [Thermovirga lienii DSM 17291]|uniref:Guanylate kinase n=1 Tax=Thermovirga lienii (strain ATCC BAA-1197 / DSM 17291 / Cas60314) TaxID=580340 RepID=G7V574_THELD|nr:guanylate kinase [Thermovirga lienii]AER66857.1 guanylate kinase [Thermovirga lienii DSM 17291]MDN5318123.1 guanylate kinase [Thermovirga sp.]MDN5367334.1 guanylate kinase [Thermovirga sp.]HCD71930.1 guanylate kinase [Thermovirga lienii]